VSNSVVSQTLPDRRKPLPPWLVTAVAFVLPGAGQMLNGDPMRGIIVQSFMMFLALVTYRVTTPEISIFGRFAGGIFVYVVSVLDAHAIANRRAKAYLRHLHAQSPSAG
jgi:TM2 domain-containing membrane protein YozV